MVWVWCRPYGQFGGLFHFSCSLFISFTVYIYVYSLSSLGDVKGLPGMFHRCDHIDWVQVKGHGGVSSTFI